MDLPWGSVESTSFVTNVGLITSKDDSGDNIMSAEWTHHISYSPALVAVSIGHGKITARNIMKIKVFGVSLAAEDQNILASNAGNYHGDFFDKIAAFEEIGLKFTRGKETGVLLVDGAVLQMECKLINMVSSGDHTLFIGEVVFAKLNNKKPLIMHDGKFWKLGEQIHKPAQDELERIKKIFEKHKRNNS